MSLRKIILTIFLSSFYIQTPALATTRLVTKTNDTELYAEPNKSSKLIKKLPQGASLEASVRKGMFWEATEGGQKVYVSIMKVKPEASGSDSNVSNALQKAVQSERQENDSANMRSRSTVMGVRGLDDTSDTAYAGTVRPNLRAVYNMENYVTPADKVNELETKVMSEVEARSENAQKP